MCDELMIDDGQPIQNSMVSDGRTTILLFCNLHLGKSGRALFGIMLTI